MFNLNKILHRTCSNLVPEETQSVRRFVNRWKWHHWFRRRLGYNSNNNYNCYVTHTEWLFNSEEILLNVLLNYYLKREKYHLQSHHQSLLLLPRIQRILITLDDAPPRSDYTHTPYWQGKTTPWYPCNHISECFLPWMWSFNWWDMTGFKGRVSFLQ